MMRHGTTSVQWCSCSNHCINGLRKNHYLGLSLLDFNGTSYLCNLGAFLQTVQLNHQLRLVCYNSMEPNKNGQRSAEVKILFKFSMNRFFLGTDEIV